MQKNATAFVIFFFFCICVMSVSAPNCLSPVGCWGRDSYTYLSLYISIHALTCCLSITLLFAFPYPSPVCNSNCNSLYLSLSLSMSIYCIFWLICIPCTYLIDFSLPLWQNMQLICTRSPKKHRWNLHDYDKMLLRCRQGSKLFKGNRNNDSWYYKFKLSSLRELYAVCILY